MTSIERSRLIDRPSADVWRFYAVEHVRNHPRWSPDLQLDQVGEGPIDVGTVILRRHSRFGEPIEGTMEIVEFEPERSMRVVIHDGPVEMNGWTSIEQEGEGTRLTIGFEILGSDDPIDPAPLDQTLDNIKTLVEAENPRTM